MVGEAASRRELRPISRGAAADAVRDSLSKELRELTPADLRREVEALRAQKGYPDLDEFPLGSDTAHKWRRGEPWGTWCRWSDPTCYTFVEEGGTVRLEPVSEVTEPHGTGARVEEPALEEPSEAPARPVDVPGEWSAYQLEHHQEFGQRLREFRNGDDTSSRPSLRGGEGQVFLSDLYPDRALKRWFASRLGDMAESVRRLRGAEAAVAADPRIREHIRVVAVHETGSDWILRDFVPDSRRLRTVKDDPGVRATYDAVMALRLHESPDELLRMLGPKVKRFGSNVHWSPSEKKLIIIDMQ